MKNIFTGLGSFAASTASSGAVFHIPDLIFLNASLAPRPAGLICLAVGAGAG
jgi:hypothetical protein